MKKLDLNAYLLLDRSSSMQPRWEETLDAMNTYVRELAATKDTKTANVTLATFSTSGRMNFDIIRCNIKANKWVPVTRVEASPGGMTPLYDAIGRCVAIAEADAPERAIIVVMTDGAENTSREYTKDDASKALDRCRGRGWQVIFIGADFDAMAQARDIGTRSGQTINMNAGNYGATTSMLARKTVAYASSGVGGQAVASVNFDDDDRKLAAGTLKP